MKNISRIFSACLCSASLFAFDAVAAVATNAGSNLTAYNPSNAYNNQWASMVNPRTETTSAKADFGNCNAVVLRCAQPKCANGGCGEMAVASAIVTGCVKSNAKCKQYGDDLINFMSAELVASSNAKINASNAEQIQAAQAAAQQAQMAAQQAAAAQQQQMAEMQSTMQQQMMQMQQQMAEQNAMAAQQLQDALAQSQQQQAVAIENIRSAAETTAQNQVSDLSITPRDENAIARGVSEEVIQREKITNKIMTDIESAEIALKEAYTAMQAAFEYAGCDTRGDNCTGPKRVKKWRELANEFIDPYDTVVDKIDTALTTAQVVGVDLSDIYMMLNDSCSSWGEYLCPYNSASNGAIYYSDPSQPNNENKGAPRVCASEYSKGDTGFWNNCQPCSLLRILTDREDVYQGWVNATNTTQNNEKVIACASSALVTSKLFARKAKAKSGAAVIDIETLGRWINYKEPLNADSSKAGLYCGATDKDDNLGQ